MAIQRIIVRMYKQLLGDCFLIRIEDSGSNRYILIDCGLLQGLADADARITAIAEDICRTTHNRLDLLIVTHEHWDHISGFSQAREIFFDKARLRIDRLWMAWTEKPGDPQADALRARFDARKLALHAALQATPADADTLLDGLQGFIGPVEPGSGGAGLGVVPAGRLTGRRIMTELQQAAAGVDHLEPGQVIEVPGGEPVRVAVLGPPRREDRLFKDLPTRGAGQETYLAEQILARALGADTGAAAAAGGGTASPFPARIARGLDRAAVESPEATAHPDTAWLHARYFAETDSATDEPLGFRRIDDLGTGAAGLALKLDSDTNNTSLALAFELPGGDFMLFAADAQVGNWLSWHDQDYDLGPRRLSATEILARTRLYKVGHHGSHNATLARLGLELMTHDDLVAMVPTVREEAAKQGSKGWQMPDPDVAAALHRRCRGRVLTGDRTWPADPDGTERTATPGDAFMDAIDQSDPLYVDFTIYPYPPGGFTRKAGP